MSRLPFKQITARDRVLISRLRARGLNVSEIARRVGKNKSSISRELRRNADVSSAEEKRFWFGVHHLVVDSEIDAYIESLPPESRPSFQESRYWTMRSAQACADSRRRRSQWRRRRKKPETRRWVIQKLRLGWSPEQIAGRSKIESPQPVSHEYVYTMLHRDKKTGGRLYRLLRRFGRRKQRLAARIYPSGPIIPNRVGIEARPKVVDCRSRLGDCEADLICGYRSSG